MAEEEKVKINAQEKLSYEQVLEVANGLQDQNQYLKNQCNQLAAKLREVSEFTAFKRLDYLDAQQIQKFSIFPEILKTCN